MQIELKRPYPRVRTDRGFSCGGSQNWFPNANFRACGCGVVACADTLLYLTGRGELGREEYTRYVNSLRRHFPLIPRHGIDGVRLAMGLNACLHEAGIPARACWRASAPRFWERLERQLADDLPGIIAIGPNFPRFWGTEELPLYRADGDAFTEAARTRAHFLAVTGLDGERMRVSSWGRELYIDRADYDRYRERHGALFTNLLQVEKKNPEP